MASSSFSFSCKQGLNCKGWIAVGTAGPQPPAIDRRGHRQTSTASARSQWAPLCLNRQGTAGPRPPVLDVAVGTAGPRQIECQNACQLECQSFCQIDCQIYIYICQRECPSLFKFKIQCEHVCQIECLYTSIYTYACLYIHTYIYMYMHVYIVTQDGHFLQ